jgi:hypothetical protein
MGFMPTTGEETSFMHVDIRDCGGLEERRVEHLVPNQIPKLIETC